MAATQSARLDDNSGSAEQLFMSGSLNGAMGDINTAYQFLNSSNGNSQTRHGAHIPKEWILLDSQSTVSIFSNLRLLRNIRKSYGWMHICCNAGITRTVENSSSQFFQISCSQGILNSSRLSCYLLLRLLVYMYLSQPMRTFTSYLKCIVISS